MEAYEQDFKKLAEKLNCRVEKDDDDTIVLRPRGKLGKRLPPEEKTDFIQASSNRPGHFELSILGKSGKAKTAFLNRVSRLELEHRITFEGDWDAGVEFSFDQLNEVAEEFKLKKKKISQAHIDKIREGVNKRWENDESNS